ncbi:MAG: hypothetical protein LBT40_13080 [Deltaproteobacteria bacterium]|jgi:hypothetical protein|nr:hypothetical protein [Deltaproteobacteria bacterium]
MTWPTASGGRPPRHRPPGPGDGSFPDFAAGVPQTGAPARQAPAARVPVRPPPSGAAGQASWIFREKMPVIRTFLASLPAAAFTALPSAVRGPAAAGKDARTVPRYPRGLPSKTFEVKRRRS